MRNSRENSPSDSTNIREKFLRAGLAGSLALSAAIGLGACDEKVNASNEPAPIETTQSAQIPESEPTEEKTYSQEDYPAYSKIDIYAPIGIAMDVDGSNADPRPEDKVRIEETDNLVDVAKKYLEQKKSETDSALTMANAPHTFPSSEFSRYFLGAVLYDLYPDNPTYQAARGSIDLDFPAKYQAEDFQNYRRELARKASEGDKAAINEIETTARQLLSTYQQLTVDIISGNAGHPGNMSTEDHDNANKVKRALLEAIVEDNAETDLSSWERDTTKTLTEKVRGKFSPEELEQAATFWDKVSFKNPTNVSLPVRVIEPNDSAFHTSIDPYYGVSADWRFDVDGKILGFNAADSKLISSKYLY